MLSTNLIFEKIENNEELDKNEKEFLSTQLLATESRDLFFKFLICNQNVTTDEQNKMLNTLSTMTNACTLETILEKLRYIMTIIRIPSLSWLRKIENCVWKKK